MKVPRLTPPRTIRPPRLARAGKQKTQDAVAATVRWPRVVLRGLRNALAAVGAGVVLGAIGWNILESKTRGYWNSW